MPNHTPEPWEFTETDDGHEIQMGSGREVQHRIAYDHGLWLDEDSSEAESEQFLEAVANARLIVAAPKLLAACKGLVEACEAMLNKVNGGHCRDVIRGALMEYKSEDDYTPMGRIENAWAAIAKAESNTP